MNTLRLLSLSAVLALTLIVTPSLAQDAMATTPMAGGAMATDAMAPMMSDDDLKVCLEQAAAITFPQVMQAASDACHGMHNGMTAPDAMAPDAMAPDAMAPAAPQ